MSTYQDDKASRAKLSDLPRVGDPTRDGAQEFNIIGERTPLIDGFLPAAGTDAQEADLAPFCKLTAHVTGAAAAREAMHLAGWDLTVALNTFCKRFNTFYKPRDLEPTPLLALRTAYCTAPFAVPLLAACLLLGAACLPPAARPARRGSASPGCARGAA